MGRLLLPLLQKLLVWVGSKIMVALGLGFITYKGFETAFEMISNYVLSNFNSLPSDAFNLLMMAGTGQALGIVLGAFMFNATMSSVSKFTAGLKS
jgi:hypothetical protein|nr:MAG TPA: Minor Head Virion Protein G6P [Inoviridae sp.]